MPLWFNKALNLTEEEIRLAMQNSLSNAEAARFCGCHLQTYRRYAKRYIDKDTGKTLYDLHNNPSGKGVRKMSFHRNPDYKGRRPFHTVSIYDILDGKHPTYDKRKFAQRLIEELLLPECCDICKFDERRITDYQVPLVLIWKDGNLQNHKLDNLQFICYNCYFLTFSDVKTKTFSANFLGFVK